jgi:uncharacterized membrane protein YsdA (DUF1294 family)
MPLDRLLFWLIFVNLLALFLFGFDKYRAKHRQWRIPEGFLFLIALLGGSLGAVIGMDLFRHKTRRTAFHRGLPVLFFLHFILCLYIFHPGG